MDYRLISLDVDGTLLDDQGNLPEANRTALLKAKTDGVHIILNTGKPASTLTSLIDQLEIGDPAITLTGGLIMQRTARDQWQVIKRYPISQMALQSLVPFFTIIPLALFVLTENRNIIYFYGSDPSFNTYMKSLLRKTNFQPAEFFDHPPLTDPQVLDQQIEKVMVISNDEQKIASLYSAMRSAHIPGIEFHISAFATIDIHAAETSKKVALEYVASLLDISASQVLALGDNETDLDVIQWAGFGAIMANGPRVIKEQAPHIAPSNQAAGVAQIINQYLLKE